MRGDSFWKWFPPLFVPFCHSLAIIRNGPESNNTYVYIFWRPKRDRLMCIAMETDPLPTAGNMNDTAFPPHTLFLLLLLLRPINKKGQLFDVTLMGVDTTPTLSTFHRSPSCVYCIYIHSQMCQRKRIVGRTWHVLEQLGWKSTTHTKLIANVSIVIKRPRWDRESFRSAGRQTRRPGRAAQTILV